MIIQEGLSIFPTNVLQYFFFRISLSSITGKILSQALWLAPVKLCGFIHFSRQMRTKGQACPIFLKRLQMCSFTNLCSGMFAAENDFINSVVKSNFPDFSSEVRAGAFSDLFFACSAESLCCWTFRLLSQFTSILHSLLYSCCLWFTMNSSTCSIAYSRTFCAADLLTLRHCEVDGWWVAEFVKIRCRAREMQCKLNECHTRSAWTR